MSAIVLTSLTAQTANGSTPKPQPERPADAKALFAAFAAMPGLEASYTEEKHLGLLAVPLKSRGRLYFLQPGYMARVVEAPEKSRLTITPRELRMAGRDGVEVVDLRKSDHLRLFVTSLVRVFRGDREALTKHYEIRYTKSATDRLAWSLALAPRKEPLTRMLKCLTLEGRGQAVTRIVLLEPSGDRTVTKIVKADPKRRFDAGERKKLFGIAAERAATPSPARKSKDG
ncbi:MAG: outer membrane lipoprotein carrier protein LolA [bacterium]|nr:outer membrane lipoprotein carrier protein LolA [bacterium]